MFLNTTLTLFTFLGIISFPLLGQNFAVKGAADNRNWDTCRMVNSSTSATLRLNFYKVQNSETSILGNSHEAQPDNLKKTVGDPLSEAKVKKVTANEGGGGSEVLQKSSEQKQPLTAQQSNAKGQTSMADSQTAPPDTNLGKELEPIKSELGEEYTGMIPKYYALVIGVDRYRNDEIGLPSLEYPVKDAKRIKKILIEKYAFDEQAVKLLENPTRSMVIDSFEEIAASITAKDNLLIFYAGHGFFDKEKGFGYWLPADARTTSKSDWISNTIIRDYMTAITAKHTLLISDACFSGSIFKSRNVMSNMIAKISEMYKYPSRRAMTSGNFSQVPDKSFFAEYLIKRLSDNTDAFLPAQTLFYRIYEPVNNNSSATPQFGVVQGTGDEGGDFIFIKRTKR